MSFTKQSLSLALLIASGGCGDDGDDGKDEGKLRVLLSAEQSISSGLRPGDGEGATKDCSVTYSKYLVAIGDVTIYRTQTSEGLHFPHLFIADMMRVGEQGVLLGEFDRVAPGQWDQFRFETRDATQAHEALEGVLPEDEQRMRAGGLTYLIEGRVECPERAVTFSFEVVAPTRYAQCESDGEPGVAVTEGGTSSATISLHGDHLWFTSLLAGEEMTVERRAAWILLADMNADGQVTTAELLALRAEQAFPSAQYSLSSANIANAYDFVKAQLSTQGHLDGEGDCTPTPL